MAEAYDLHSNIKGKPGSQGTLFQVRDKSLLNPEQRWPRGYTPERQAEVSDAFKGTLISGAGEAVRPYGAGTHIDGKQVPYRVYPEARAKIVDAAARSTAPAEHLTGIENIHRNPAKGHKATYWPGKREIGVDMQSEGADRSLIHEIGHHVDSNHTRETSQALAGVDTAHARSLDAGVGEAVADKYYMEHYRAPGRKGGKPTKGLYQETFEPARLDKEYPGYSDVLPHTKAPLNTSQFSKETLF